MSNRIDFYQASQSNLALAGANVMVLLDGRLCPYLRPLEIVRGIWPEFSRARLGFNQAGYDGDISTAAEDTESELSMGKSICIQRHFNRSAPGASACAVPVFAGQIEQVDSAFVPKGERIEILAGDFSANLKRITVYGRCTSQGDDLIIQLPGFDTIFNEDGKANAAAATFQRNGYSYRLFSADTSQAGMWSYADAIRYLLCEYFSAGQLRIPSQKRLEALTSGKYAYDLDVTGLNLAEALQKCCERVGLRFRFVPRFDSSGPLQGIEFYKAGFGRSVELNCQAQGERFSISDTNISAIRSKRNFRPVTNKYIGQGDFRVYEATFELVRAWESSLEDTDYDKFSCLTNSDFHKVKDVYRKWCLNEAGDYSGAAYNQGQAFDFSEVFGTGNFVRRCRRFWPALTTDRQGKSLGYFLQVSFDNGGNWRQYLYAFNNLLGECGIWLSSEQLDVETWVAALKGVLKFRITASVVSDERLSCWVADGPIDSTVPVVEKVYTLPRQFRYRKVSGKSIFAGSTDDSIGKSDEVNDSAALYEFVRHRAKAGSASIESIDVQTPYLALDYQPGDRVTTSPEGRDILGCRSDSRSVKWIERVEMDFEKQCTNLKIKGQRRLYL